MIIVLFFFSIHVSPLKTVSAKIATAAKPFPCDFDIFRSQAVTSRFDIMGDLS
jgi:hypothetical protein